MERSTRKMAPRLEELTKELLIKMKIVVLCARRTYEKKGLAEYSYDQIVNDLFWQGYKYSILFWYKHRYSKEANS